MDEDEPRRPGRLKGCIRIAPDFDDPLPEEIAAAFRGEETLYLLSIPGMRESIQEGIKTPVDECAENLDWSTDDQDPPDVDPLRVERHSR